ncbi:MAG TPA: M20/M25/M40 family metallo-hydrolase [Gemmatimonadales bacterium]|nr:M20/M25/M40 family metallo-hydrolase [Gemmatimonadales bacterium]
MNALRLVLPSLLAWSVGAGAWLAAQSPASIQRAVNSITAEDVARRIGIIAHDSMRGRDTPSPELEETAQYIAAEFRRFGLKPGGDDGTFLQRYGVIHKALDTAATVIALRGPQSARLKAGVDANVIRFGALPDREIAGPIVMFSGPGDPAHPLAGADVKGAWVAQVLTATPQGVQLDVPLAMAALEAGAAGILLVTNRPDAQWQNRMGRITAPVVALEGRTAPEQAPAIVEIRDPTAARLLGIDPAAARAATRREARRLEGYTLTFRPVERVLSRVTAPNVVGVLEGSDPVLKREHLVYSAHMDHVGVAGSGGCGPVGADSICNGADDDASGTIAVVEAAEAFAQLDPRPKRSIIFLTVSGEEKGLWGSAHFAEHPPVPLADLVANLNLDMVGRNWKDTIAVIGREHSDLGDWLERVAAAHPELDMHPIGDLWPQERFYFRSDHYNFARKGVPILFFFNGTHPDYHRPTDEPEKIDAEKEARIVKLVFHLGLEIANAPERPRWNPESYRRIVESAN